MTSLNKLFSRYFIFTIAVVLVIITLMSNFGASVFFKEFVRHKNDEKNKVIVEVVQSMLEDDTVSQNIFQVVLSWILRQEQAVIILYKNDEEVFKTGINPNKRGMEIGDQTTEQAENTTEMEYLSYQMGEYLLQIGRAKDPLYDIANANFVKTLNIVYVFSFAVAMIVAFFAAWILSKKFNKPIMQLKENVNHISMNRYDRMKKCNTKAKELRELSEDIENLAIQIQKEDSMRKRLSNDIVHELKTPIAVLSTNIEAILDGVYKADEERMVVLLNQINRLTRLVNNLSELTLIETDYKEIKKEAVNISGILEDIHTIYLPAATDKKIMMYKEIEKNIFINGNEDKLLQLFVNVVSNALKYTDEQGEIYIRVFIKGMEVICEIEDTGMGIDEKDQPFIFNRFYRSDESRSRETGGSGIGLAIAKAVVSAHDGEIKLESKKGIGTKISITFQKMQYKSP